MPLIKIRAKKPFGEVDRSRMPSTFDVSVKSGVVSLNHPMVLISSLFLLLSWNLALSVV
jgi:hypothetical protein